MPVFMDKKRRGRRRRTARSVLSAGLAALLAGCAAGPDFVPPAPPPVKTYGAGQTSAVLSPGASEAAQRLVSGQAVSARWWELYHSSRLNEVLDLAIAGSPTLTAAEATLAQARQAVIQARGGFFPQLDFTSSAQRQGTPSSRFGGSSSFAVGESTTFNLYSLGPTVSFSPDVFGGTRRQVEQQKSLAENKGYQLAAAFLTLTGNSVTQAINIASARLQIGAAQDIVTDDERNLRLVRLKFEGGKATRLDVLTAESQLANDRALLPPLQQQLSIARHALTILVGRFPGQWTAPDFDLAELALPAELPLSVPSDLVHQRPDILAAEAQLHAASAAIGIAASQLYPKITLSGSLGYESLATSTLFQASSQFWSLVVNLTAPVFHGGTLEAQKQAAVEAFRASAATYQQTVLSAFGQIADVLRALAHDADLVSAQKNALDTSATTLGLQRLSYQAGKSDLLQLLDAERAYQQARLGYARAQSQRYQDTAQLFVAMGGGWWNAQTIPASIR
ncbi:MAG: efflux transporter outer membrane subunit [Desulfobacteraceae bacterium]|nr:efflux transporter outer membrane subunit [Desulfobacteraceae bacterium]